MTRVAVLGLLSPVVAATAGWLVLEQWLSALQVVGAAVVIAAVTLAQLGDRLQSSPAGVWRVAWSVEHSRGT